MLGLSTLGTLLLAHLVTPEEQSHFVSTLGILIRVLARNLVLLWACCGYFGVLFWSVPATTWSLPSQNTQYLKFLPQHLSRGSWEYGILPVVSNSAFQVEKERKGAGSPRSLFRDTA